MNEDMLVRQAKAVLDFNWTGEYTMPGPKLYPHQWSWDSAFIAIGYSRYDQERATRELRHLFEAQWKNGLLPQLVFNPHFTNIIKHFRAIATRYEKTARNFLAGVHLVCALAWLK
jgi:transposase